MARECVRCPDDVCPKGRGVFSYIIILIWICLIVLVVLGCQKLQMIEFIIIATIAVITL